VAILWPVASDLLVALLSLHTFRIATLASLATKSESCERRTDQSLNYYEEHH
jgi:hypothetical protein